VLRLVLDTDVLVAAIRSRFGASSQLVERALSGSYTLLLSVPLVLEYEEVLTRPEHLKAAGLAVTDIEAVVTALIAVAHPVRNSYLWRPRLPDPDDDMVLETAVNGTATALVTFNQRHFVPLVKEFDCRVWLPSEALRFLQNPTVGILNPIKE